VPDVRRRLALVAGGLAGAVAAVLFRHRGRTEPGAAPPADPRAQELRRKLAQAREAAVEDDDFEVAGMGAEVMVEDERRPTAPERLPDDVEEARRRVHEEGRSAAEEMRREPDREERR
jgi:hypothetical protein